MFLSLSLWYVLDKHSMLLSKFYSISYIERYLVIFNSSLSIALYIFIYLFFPTNLFLLPLPLSLICCNEIILISDLYLMSFHHFVRSSFHQLSPILQIDINNFR